MNLDRLYQKLWEDYTLQNPSTLRIYKLFNDRGEKVVNDHIAFRTFNDPRMSIAQLAMPFLERGYIPKGSYKFESKHLNATHFELPEKPDAPRVFISELILEEFSSQLQKVIRESLDRVDQDLYESNDLIFAGSIFGPSSYAVYEQLREESEYAAWMYVHGFRVNHFTVSVNHLNSFKGIEEVNQYLKDQHLTLNSSGGEVKGSGEELLKQSSTLAEIISLPFIEGFMDVPACYYEFAERFRNANGQLFSGFIAGSADKIFESTDFYKK